MYSAMSVYFLYDNGHHRDLHVRTHSFPPRRSSDLARQAILYLVPALDDPAAALRHLEGDALGGIDAAAHADDAVAERREVVGQRVSGPPRELVFLDDRAHERVVALQGVGEDGKLRQSGRASCRERVCQYV